MNAKAPDPKDEIAVLLFNAEQAFKKVAIFPELRREQAWSDFISLRSWTEKLIKALNHIHSDRKRAKAAIERRCEELAGCTEGSAEEVELRVLSELLEPGWQYKAEHLNRELPK